MTVTCEAEPRRATTELQFAFYRNGHNVQGFSSSNQYGVPSAQLEHSGSYICEVPLAVHKGDLYEGDSLSLRCHSWPGYRAKDPVFYKDYKIIESPVSESVLHIGRVDVTASGTYKCEKKIRYLNSATFNTYTDHYTISVSELFSLPQIEVRPDQDIEGDHMTITCDTKLSPRRANTELRFAFYRNGHNVQGFSLSNQYGVPSAQLEDSGNYTCDVQTLTGSVRKRSNVTHIQIQELFSWPQIKQSEYPVNRGENMTITCDTDLSPHRETTELQFAFYRNGHNVQGFSSSNQYGVPSAQLEDSGNYTCEVQTPTGSVRKRSNMFTIQKEEMFSSPQIKVSPDDQVTEGDHMTITCDTKLSPHRETTELQFVFYRNGHNVQGFSSSNQYGVPSAQLEDSGNYICEVQTSSGKLFNTPQVSVNQYPWREGDPMTLTCDTKLSPRRATTELQFAFYRNGHNVQRFRSSNQYGVPSAQLEDSGNYTCEVQTPTGKLFSSPQIKVNPDQVTEGDHMTITCDTKLSPHRETTELQFVFYRNGHNVQGFNSSNQYGVPSAQLKDSGNYACEVQTPSGKFFSRPQIKHFPDPVTPGENMTITCDTKLSPHRETTELQFVFYRNGHNVQGFSSFNQYGVPSAQLEHSGNYTCEVQTPTGSVRKRSNVIHIQILDRSGTFMILVLALVLLVVFLITAAVLVFLFRHKLALLLFGQCQRPKTGIYEGPPVWCIEEPRRVALLPSSRTPVLLRKYDPCSSHHLKQACAHARFLKAQ
ncbi:hypothetical protein XELAEV_18042838mg [Xenopus laevis]|uniref:Ig-like domain-containing protein n=1 Tax=Xenopus laevis TaxID=8355 RepID=A0A974H6X6_XENLA|nr:hypothetical protein XELAEV_18042838mg [Xenopus laevis]